MDQNDDYTILLTSLLIQQARTYDVLLAILMESNLERAADLKAMHENGELWAPPPSFLIDEDDSTDG